MNTFVSVLFFTDTKFIYYLQLSTERIEIPYVLLVYEADKFCNLTVNDSLFDQLNDIRSHYPAYTVCYVTNRLFSYINKRWVIFFNFISTSFLLGNCWYLCFGTLCYDTNVCVYGHICVVCICQSISCNDFL
jgi:hypothetical protein